MRLEVFENDVTGMSNGIDVGAGGDASHGRAAAPRLFCDICDEVRTVNLHSNGFEGFSYFDPLLPK